MQLRRTAQFALLLSLVVTLTSFAFAGPYSAVVAYGDSLSDNGNLFQLIGQPGPPYWMGRFSNGPVAAEGLASQLGAPLLDYAVGGATTGVGNVGDNGTQTTTGFLGLPGMFPEVGASIGTITPIAPSALFVVWGGPNDFASNGFTMATADTAVSDLLAIISELQSLGATHFLVPGMPDLGLTPRYHGNAGATALSLYFNHELMSLLPKGAIYFDTFGLMHQVVANPGAYGFTDVTDPCFNGVTVCSDPSQYLFWDDFHPTSAGHNLLAEQFYDAATPEPSTLLMLGTGIAGVIGTLRRKWSA